VFFGFGPGVFQPGVFHYGGFLGLDAILLCPIHSVTLQGSVQFHSFPPWVFCPWDRLRYQRLPTMLLVSRGLNAPNCSCTG
jgi:hypothetical protein